MQLSQLMQLAMEIGMSSCRDGELKHPFAVAAPQFSNELTYLSIHMPSKAAAQMAITAALLQDDLYVCVVVMEAWVAKLDAKNPAHRSYLQKMKQGRFDFKNLPPGLRESQLILIGEDRDGFTADRSWTIVRENDGVQFTLLNDNVAKMRTPWRPMFAENIAKQQYLERAGRRN